MTAISDQSSIAGPWNGWLATLLICAALLAGTWLCRAIGRRINGRMSRAERARQHELLINHYAHASACARQAARKQEDASRAGDPEPGASTHPRTCSSPRTAKAAATATPAPDATSSAPTAPRVRFDRRASTTQ